MVSTEQRAPKRIGPEQPPPASRVSFLNGVLALIDEVARPMIGPLAERLAAVEQRLDARGDRPADAIRFGERQLYSIQDIAAEMQCHPETAASWTRLPADNPQRLVRVSDRPILVLAADFADWLERRREMSS